MKTCSACEVPKAENEFKVRSRGGLDAYCIPCRNEKNRASYARNAEGRKARNRARWKTKR